MAEFIGLIRNRVGGAGTFCDDAFGLGDGHDDLLFLLLDGVLGAAFTAAAARWREVRNDLGLFDDLENPKCAEGQHQQVDDHCDGKCAATHFLPQAQFSHGRVVQGMVWLVIEFFWLVHKWVGLEKGIFKTAQLGYSGATA
ncbi:MAG: hypothetical protein DVB26_02510 [Verrucomicrobia bacterium]|nr:MAG: hypothetical protein DVB26_02510 [Verrucomicrobiota bacterium]